MKARVFADFHNLDDESRVRLDSNGTRDDLARLGVQLVEGLQLTLYTDDADEAGRPDDLLVDAVAFHGAEGWVAAADWATLRHQSDEAAAQLKICSISSLAMRQSAGAVLRAKSRPLKSVSATSLSIVLGTATTFIMPRERSTIRLMIENEPSPPTTINASSPASW